MGTINDRVLHVLALSASCFLGISSVGCGEVETLAKDDVLIVAFEPGYLYVQSPKTGVTCEGAGGVVVRIIGIEADGQPAKDAKAVVWLGSGSVGALATLPGLEPLTAPHTVTLGGEDGSAQVCLLASARGSITVHARSGVVEASSVIAVRDKTVPAGGKLALSVSPLTSGSRRAAAATSCGDPPPDACVPGRARSAAISLRATSPDTGPPLPDEASVVLSVDQGWLSVDPDCNAGDLSNQLPITLEADKGTATWCFGDTGAAAKLTAESGAVTATSELAVPSIPAALQLGATQTAVAADEVVTVSAFVADCGGAGVANQPVLFNVVSGGLQFSSTDGVTRTGADGVATVTATVTAPPVELSAKLVGLPSHTCGLSLGARQ
jgi:hypothetical protein